MSLGERRARIYCGMIGADPDEMVCGQVEKHVRISMPRWRWYVGAIA
jgi:hypothetical protein